MKFKILFLMLAVVLSFSFSHFAQSAEKVEVVQLVYFFPTDRPIANNFNIEDELNALVKGVQDFYKDEMIRLGFANGLDDKTFDFKPVEFYAGKFDQAAYVDSNTGELNSEKVVEEIGTDVKFDLLRDIHLIATNMDINSVCGQGRSLLGDYWSRALMSRVSPSNKAWAIFQFPQSAKCSELDLGFVVAHELGHAFGLRHDFLTPDNIMSYNTKELSNQILSPCAAEWLEVCRAFNFERPGFLGGPIEISEPDYSLEKAGLHISFELSNFLGGFHSAQLHVVPTNIPEVFYPESPTLRAGWVNLDSLAKLTLYGCESVEGNLLGKATVKFVYSEISSNPITDIELRVIDEKGNLVRKQFKVPMNYPPMTKERIEDMHLIVGTPRLLEVTTKFSDPNGGQLEHSVQVTDRNVADTRWVLFRKDGESQAQSMLEITPKRVGETWIIVKATDPTGLSATQRFKVTVAPRNQKPMIVETLPPQTLSLGSSSLPLDLATYFLDLDSASIIYTAKSSNTTVATVQRVGSVITILAKGIGAATVTVTATDSDGASTTQPISVTVETNTDTPLQNRAPRVSRQIQRHALTMGNSTAFLPVSSYFSDPDGDTLMYTTSTRNTSVVTVSRSGSPVLITPVAAGTAIITVTASDGKLQATQSFVVTITANSQQNRAPEVSRWINRQNFRVGDAPKWRNLSSYFSDPDGDALTYTATSSNNDVVVTSRSRNSVEIIPGKPGTATVTVTARDTEGLTATQSFEVTVQVKLETIPSLPVCSRTPQVRDEIMKRVHITNCAKVTEDDLESISRLSIIEEDLTTLKQGDFDELRSLEDLVLNGNFLRKLPEDVFWYLGELKELSLKNNQITTLVEDIFEHLDSLTYLTLYGNQITTLQEGAFNDLDNLIELDLRENQLTTLPAGVFEDLSNLEELDLENNRIAILSRDGFLGLSSLEDLYLDGNLLHTIRAGAFNGLSNLTELDFNNYPLHTIETGAFNGLSNLQSLDLDENQLAILPVGIFSGLNSLTRLKLYQNQLTTLPANIFNGLSNLQSLHLDENRLATLPANIFNGLSNLQSLRLDENRLATLPAGIFKHLSSLTYLNLRDNPGAPFTLMLKLVRTDNADPEAAGSAIVKVKLAEGAPFDMSIRLSVEGGTLSADTAILATGQTESNSITVTQKGARVATVQFGTAPTLPQNYSGIQMAVGSPLVLFSDDPNVLDLSPEILIPDENLRTVLRTVLKLQEGDTITHQKMQQLTQVNASIRKIKDITGLEHATRLRQLWIDSNTINDLTPLKNLTSLTFLSLSWNEISDLTPLANLRNLTELQLRQNRISDLTPLANLTSLTSLSLSWNEISDLTPLANLRNLTELQLRQNRISDLTPLANLTSLTSLSLPNNRISDVSPLANLTALTHLGLHGNQIRDVTALEGLTSLKTLWLTRNPIEDLAPLRKLKHKNPNVNIDINAAAAPSAPVLPTETALLLNYPNPFNPETWIPYQLVRAADVTLTIYNLQGSVVRRLVLGHRPAGFYHGRGRAAHWDGENQFDEPVASGVYFYTITAGDFTATRKMLIRK